MKKGIVALVIVALLGLFYLYMSKQRFDFLESFNHYESVPNMDQMNMESETQSILDSFATQSLESGLNTNFAKLQTTKVSAKLKTAEKYQLMVNGKVLNVLSVSPIELTAQFKFVDKDVFIVNYNQGGNACAVKYRYVAVYKDKTITSKAFGTCLPLSTIKQVGNDIIITIAQNDPYISDNLYNTYTISNDKLQVTKAKPSAIQIMSSSDILKLAKQDGCYVDDILLDNNACGGGKKYCTLFFANKSRIHDASYSILWNFCH